MSETLRTYLKVETLWTGALLLFTARSARACLILHRVGVYYCCRLQWKLKLNCVSIYSNWRRRIYWHTDTHRPTSCHVREFREESKKSISYYLLLLLRIITFTAKICSCAYHFRISGESTGHNRSHDTACSCRGTAFLHDTHLGAILQGY